MSFNQIKVSLLRHLKTLSGFSPEITIYYPNISEDLPTDNHIRPDVLPGTTNPIGLRTTDQETGILQVSIFIKKGQGEIKAADNAKVVLDGFPRNLQLEGVRIDRPGSIGPSFFDGNWQVTPVSIFYQHIS